MIDASLLSLIFTNIESLT